MIKFICFNEQNKLKLNFRVNDKTHIHMLNDKKKAGNFM